MKKVALIAALAFAVTGSAHATIFGGTTNNDNSVENHGGHGGHGGQGGAGGSAAAVGVGVGIAAGGNATGGSVGDIRNTNSANGGSVIGSGNSANNIRNENSQGQGQDQAQGQLQGQQQAAISGGNNLEGNKTNVSVNSLYERSAPAVFAGNVPVVAKSCRLYFFGGGSNRDGAVSGTLPIGNDKTCLSGVKLDMMERIGGFTRGEMQQVACGVEGMDSLQTCKDLKKVEARKQGYEGNDEKVIDRMVKF